MLTSKPFKDERIAFIRHAEAIDESEAAWRRINAIRYASHTKFRTGSQGFVLRGLAVDLLQELQPLDVSVVLLALADDLAIQNVERGKQRRRAVALVVMGIVSARPFLSGSPGCVRSSA
jgi:hypothetical protein